MTTGDKVTLSVVTVVFLGGVYAMRPETDEEKRYYAQQRRQTRANPTSLLAGWWE